MAVLTTNPGRQHALLLSRPTCNKLIKFVYLNCFMWNLVFFKRPKAGVFAFKAVRFIKVKLCRFIWVYFFLSIAFSIPERRCWVNIRPIIGSLGTGATACSSVMSGCSIVSYIMILVHLPWTQSACVTHLYNVQRLVKEKCNEDRSNNWQLKTYDLHIDLTIWSLLTCRVQIVRILSLCAKLKWHQLASSVQCMCKIQMIMNCVRKWMARYSIWLDTVYDFVHACFGVLLSVLKACIYLRYRNLSQHKASDRRIEFTGNLPTW